MTVFSEGGGGGVGGGGGGGGGGGRENTTIFPDPPGESVNETLSILPLQKEGKSISSNDWLLGSHHWQRGPSNMRDS